MTIKPRGPGFSREPPTSRARRRLDDRRHPRIFALARRLLRGEIVEVTDQHGRLWRGTASSLTLVVPGDVEKGPFLDGANAYDIAVELAAVDGFDR